MKRRVLIGLAVFVGLIVIAVLVTASIWPVLNDVTTGETPAYPDVLPQYFSTDPARVYDESVAAVEELDDWEVVEAKEEERVVEATRETTLFGFVDDITITVQPQTEFVTVVKVRSRSRVGKGDFGQNARNIREFQAELDERLGAVRFNPYENSDQSPGDRTAGD
jgi:uncharacterized protein (DUF1499 family)